MNKICTKCGQIKIYRKIHQHKKDCKEIFETTEDYFSGYWEIIPGTKKCDYHVFINKEVKQNG